MKTYLVQSEYAGFAFYARGHALAVLSVRAGRVRAGVAPGVLTHAGERRIVVAIRTENETLALHAGREIKDLKNVNICQKHVNL